MRNRFSPRREDFKPKGGIKITHKATGCVLWLYNNANGKPCAVAFSGKRNKPDLHIQYKTAERREQHVREYLDRVAGSQNFKAEQAAKRKAYRHTLQPGDILSGSWGYDQTNPEFWQVIRTTTTTAIIRELSQQTSDKETGNSMADYRLPVKDSFVGEEKTVRVGIGDYCKVEHCGLSRWDGKPKYNSWYA
jgi:hypothetical protein